MPTFISARRQSGDARAPRFHRRRRRKVEGVDKIDATVLGSYADRRKRKNVSVITPRSHRDRFDYSRLRSIVCLDCRLAGNYRFARSIPFGKHSGRSLAFVERMPRVATLLEADIGIREGKISRTERTRGRCRRGGHVGIGGTKKMPGKRETSENVAG